jgi:hypothetical protein
MPRRVRVGTDVTRPNDLEQSCDKKLEPDVKRPIAHNATPQYRANSPAAANTFCAFGKKYSSSVGA